MDLSKKQKTRRDAVEAALLRVEKLLDQLEEVHTRTDAATRVWKETSRTLQPAMRRLEEARSDLKALQEELSALLDGGVPSEVEVGSLKS